MSLGSTETIFEIIETHYPNADMPTVFELANNPYGLFVAKKVVRSLADDTPIQHDVDNWAEEVTSHFVETLKDTQPMLAHPGQTAAAGYLACVDLAIFEAHFGDTPDAH